MADLLIYPKEKHATQEELGAWWAEHYVDPQTLDIQLTAVQFKEFVSWLQPQEIIQNKRGTLYYKGGAIQIYG